MSELIYESKSARGTQSFAEELAGKLVSGRVLALSGELGAGKTSFVQGLARGLGVFDLSQVLSPTYTLVNEYPGRVTLVHIDFYRLKDLESAIALGLGEQIGRPNTVTAIEWAEMLPELLPKDHVMARLSRLTEKSRRIVVTGL